jgi:acyl-CoA thioesterase I
MPSRAQRYVPVLLAVLSLLPASAAQAEPLRVVAVGASNTWGWGVRHAYPELLQGLLRKNGVEALVRNAGVNFSTTRGMLKRLDAVVPQGTHIVIIEPGRNDLRFFGTLEKRAENVRAMVARVQERGMKAIVYEPTYASEDFQWDRIHLTAKAHAKIAADLMPKVMAAMQKPAEKKPPAKPARQQR